MEAIWRRVRTLATHLRDGLQAIPGVTVQDIGEEQCGIVTFTVAGTDAQSLKQLLAEQAINVTISTVTSTRYDMEARGLTEVVRSSVHYYNDEAEIERFCDVVASRQS